MENFLQSSVVGLQSFVIGHPSGYASLRRDRAMRAPDAVQLSCAGSAGEDLFVTNDVRLHGKHVPGIHFIASIETVPI